VVQRDALQLLGIRRWRRRTANNSKKGSKRKLPYHKTSGKTRTRWADVVQRDALQLLGIRRWRRRTANKDE
jgi:ribosomal protein L30/L7E